MTAAIYYAPDGYSTAGPKLMGRNAAGESFLRGFFAHNKADALWVQVDNAEYAQHFAAAARAMGREEPISVVQRHTLGQLSQVGTLYFPGTNIGEQAHFRAHQGHRSWSLCGITHTTSSAFAMDALVALTTSPVQPWDAVICTSLAVKDNVERVLAAQFDYLNDRLGITKMVKPQLPVIPLGIHTDDFVSSDEQKAQARSSVGADDSTLVVLYMGRLSFHAKAHPLAMYQALESAALQTGKKVLLIECGWHANEAISQAFSEAAQLACPSVRVVTLDGRLPSERQTAWACADVFCSLSDNIQETFGITPIEAMAAGLPVVVSDWDGYKDTVRDGIDGFRVPTTMPGPGWAQDLAVRHALEIDTYDRYCGYSCSFVAVDIAATAAAFIRLFNSAQLRRDMGEAGRKRAVEVYDWRVIVGRYEALWQELAEIRSRAVTRSEQSPAGVLERLWPARLDPFYAFASYPTESLTPTSVLALVDANVQDAITRTFAYKNLGAVGFANAVLPNKAEITQLIRLFESGPKAIVDAVATLPEQRHVVWIRSLAWLLKLGILKKIT